MPAVVGALRAELSASIAQFQDDMGKAAAAVRAFAADAEKQAAKLERVGKQLSISLTAPLVAFGYASVKAGTDSTKAMAQVEAALKSTGGVSGKTADQLKESADQLQDLTLFGSSDILAKVTASLLSFSNVQGPVFDRAQKDAVDLAARFGIDLQGAAVALGRALQNPAKGLDGLRRQGVLFSADQKKLVTQLQATGQGAKAQGIILEQVEKQVAGAAVAARQADPFGALKASLNSLEEAWGPLIVDFLTPTIKLLTGLAKAFRDLPEPVKALAVAIGTVLAVAGPVILIGSTLIKTFGNLLKVIGLLAAPIEALGGAMAAAVGVSLGALLGWAAALGAAVAAIVIFWKSIMDLIHGDFKQAWTDAKESAQKLVDSVNGIFKKNPAKLPVTIQTSAPGDKGANGGFDIPDQVAAATKTLEKQLSGMNLRVNAAFGQTQLPKSVAAANDLNAQIDEYIKQAQEAGVGTAEFGKQIDALRASIEKLKQAGVAKEAKAFTEAVNDETRAVDQFGKGGADPLTEKLQAVDDQYKQLHDKITDQIDANKALAEVNANAATAMEKLKADLDALAPAHDKARKAAEDQYAAEQNLSHLQSLSNQADIRNQVQDLQQKKTGTGPIGSAQTDIQNAGRDLEKTLIDAETKLNTLYAQRRAGENTLSDQQKKDLDDEIKLQRTYTDLVGQTTAEEITAAERIKQAYSTFTDDLSNSLSSMIANWKVDLNGLRSVFAELARQLFIKPATDALSSGIGGALKGLGNIFGSGGDIGTVDVTPSPVTGGFSGFHAAGGFVPPGQWGIAGEKGPEPVFGGKSGMTVYPNSTMGGVTVIQNINTPDVGAFRSSRRQLARQAKMALG